MFKQQRRLIKYYIRRCLDARDHGNLTAIIQQSASIDGFSSKTLFDIIHRAVAFKDIESFRIVVGSPAFQALPVSGSMVKLYLHEHRWECLAALSDHPDLGLVRLSINRTKFWRERFTSAELASLIAGLVNHADAAVFLWQLFVEPTMVIWDTIAGPLLERAFSQRAWCDTFDRLAQYHFDIFHSPVYIRVIVCNWLQTGQRELALAMWDRSGCFQRGLNYGQSSESTIFNNFVWGAKTKRLRS